MVGRRQDSATRTTMRRTASISITQDDPAPHVTMLRLRKAALDLGLRSQSAAQATSDSADGVSQSVHQPMTVPSIHPFFQGKCGRRILA